MRDVRHHPQQVVKDAYTRRHNRLVYNNQIPIQRVYTHVYSRFYTRLHIIM